jgi:NAD(P)-dependent dehydrogenase (short-subunit alcohol dehydrogenase family)
VDILCNAAGILRDRMIFNMTEEEWDAVLRVHLHGTFNMVRNVVPHMIRQRYGRIVLFSSISALGNAGQSNYSAAKEGIVGFARALARELASDGISVNAVYPGANTRMLAMVQESARRILRGQQGAGEASGAADLIASEGLPEEAMAPENNAPKIVYLCSEPGGAITGQVIGTNGWEMALYSPRRVTRSIHKKGRWTLDELERLVPASLARGLVNPAPLEPPTPR